MELGADKDKTDNNGASPLFTEAANGHLAVVKYLLENSTDKNKATNDGLTLLHVAAMQGDAKVVSHLMNSGASLTARDTEGWLPIDHAANKKIELLIRDEEKRRSGSGREQLGKRQKARLKQ